MRQRQPQMPDVGRLFRKHFGERPRRLRLTFGSDGSFIHNLEFLSVLTHESHLQAAQVQWKEGGAIRIPLLRERTELPFEEGTDGLLRFVSKSLLTISPVSAVSWIFHREPPANSKELELFSIHLGVDFWNGESDSFTIHLVGQLWRCDLSIGSRVPVLRLSDQELTRLEK